MLFPVLWLPLFSTGSYSHCPLVCCPLVFLVLFSRSFVFLCLSVVSMFLGGIACGLSYLVDERPGGYTDVCRQSRVSSRSALLPPSSSGARCVPWVSIRAAAPQASASSWFHLSLWSSEWILFILSSLVSSVISYLLLGPSGTFFIPGFVTSTLELLFGSFL